MLPDMVIKKGHRSIKVDLPDIFQVLLADLGEKSPGGVYFLHRILRFFSLIFIRIKGDCRLKFLPCLLQFGIVHLFAYFVSMLSG